MICLSEKDMGSWGVTKVESLLISFPFSVGYTSLYWLVCLNSVVDFSIDGKLHPFDGICEKKLNLIL